jgi:hypothetical protein
VLGSNDISGDIGVTGPMTIERANQAIRIISKFTKEISVKVNSLINRLQAMDPKDRAQTTIVEAEVGQLIEGWNAKVTKLGGQPKGMWLVDIDAGDGYYCWKFPEPEIAFWHEYKSGYTGRVPITKRAEIAKTNENRPSPDQPAPW